MRTIRVSTALAGYSAWPGLAQVAEVRSRVTILTTGEVREQTRSLLTSLSAREGESQTSCGVPYRSFEFTLSNDARTRQAGAMH